MRTPEIDFVLRDSAASTWIKTALESALRRDACDAANDAEVLAWLLAARSDAVAAQFRATEAET